MGLFSSIGKLLGGSVKNKTTKSSVRPLPYEPVEPALEELIEAIQASMGGTIGQSGESLVAGMDPAELEALALARQIPGRLAPLQQDIFGTAAFLADPSRLDVAGDPQLGAIAEAIVAPFLEGLQQDVLPGIRDDFVGAGQGANTPREQEFQTRAMERTGRAASQAVAPLYENARQSNLNAMTQTILGSPALSQLLTAGIEPLANLGARSRDVMQATLNAPRDLLSEYGNMLLQFPFGTAGQQQTPYRSGGLLSGVGGVLGVNAASKAAGFGNIASWFSDDLVKKDVEVIDTTPDGLDVIEFEYEWGGGRKRGFRAQQVQDKYPEAVILMPTPDGRAALAVDYDRLEELRYGSV